MHAVCFSLHRLHLPVQSKTVTLTVMGPVVRARARACERAALRSSEAHLKRLYGAAKGGIFRVEGGSKFEVIHSIKRTRL